MFLQKQAIDFSFAQGLDTKTDPKRVSLGKFLKLENSIFNKGGLLQKRNGFGQLSSLPDTSYTYLTTFHDNLTAIGTNIAAFNTPGDKWSVNGAIQPLSLNTVPVIRNNFTQSAIDVAIAPNGAACAVYLEAGSGSTINKFVVFDSVTGQNLSPPTAIAGSGTVSGGMKVFVLGSNFVIVFTDTISAVPHLRYITVNIYTPSMVSTPTDITNSYVPATTVSWDGYVVNDKLYLAYDTTAGGQSVKVTYLTKGLTLAPPVTFAGIKATIMSLVPDTTNPASPNICISAYRSDTMDIYTFTVDQNLNTLMAPQHTLASVDVANLTSTAFNNTCYLYYEVNNNYSFSPGTGNATHYIGSRNINFITELLSSPVVIIRSVGLASKAFLVNNVTYALCSYQSSYQSTYFLVNLSDSLSSAPVIASKLAYANGGGYLTTGLPGVSIYGDAISIGYQFKDLITAANKNTAVPAGSQTAGIYSQTGINMATFTFGTSHLDTAEISNDLHISGGFLWMYDGYRPIEHNFFLWPDVAPTASPDPTNTSVAAWSTTGGQIHAQPDGSTNTNAYFYQFTYEWTDNQGNAFRSAPSIPVAVTTTGSGNTGSIALNIPTLRLTMKTATPVKIVIYRWSVAQQNYYQVTTIAAPLINDPTVDSISFTDSTSDENILGNNLIYTTGGVIEDVNAPATDIMALFDTRLWIVDSEDRNLLWFSKQCIEATPVEMSDLFTIFVPPTVGTATGEITSLFPMDDKLIISKGGNAFVYINGNGPDNTGANNQYSQPIFITSTVGCSNQKSFVVIPQGLMFQSNKGIWLLGRGLDTQYIGAPVEDFTTGATVLSAIAIPETNQVRFTLDSGVTLMYDYFYGQWSTFTGIPALSSCIFNSLHTFINAFGATYQESPGVYLDGSNPVLMAFQTGPLRVGDLQNYQRAYFFYLLGTFISPHKLNIGISYDYEINPSQNTLVSPKNYSTPYGSGSSQSPYGQGNPYGGPSSLENERIFLQRMRCQAFSIFLQEVFDSSFGTVAGAGFTLSGLNLVAAFKRGFRPQPNVNSAG